MGAETIALIALQVVAVLATLVERVRIRSLARRLARANAAWVDESTGLLTAEAIALRMSPEIEWARAEGVPMTVLMFRFGTYEAEAGMRAIATSLRGYENGFRLSDNECAVALWDADAEAASVAQRRLLRSVGTAPEVRLDSEIDVAIAVFPDYGKDARRLLKAARRRLSPVEVRSAMLEHAA